MSGGEHYGTHANVPRAELSARDVFFHRAVINRVRATYLGLSPLGEDPEGELGLGSVITMLGGG